MSLTIRPAIPADAEIMAALDARGNDNPLTLVECQRACAVEAGELASGQWLALVAESGRDHDAVCEISNDEVNAGDNDSVIVGIIVYTVVLDEASLMAVTVDTHCQRHGVGGSLLTRALEEMRFSGSRRCLLEVRVSNAAALGLYHAHGFQKDGLRKAYYATREGREDAVLMTKHLSPEPANT